jgi:hypothetical protein
MKKDFFVERQGHTVRISPGRDAFHRVRKIRREFTRGGTRPYRRFERKRLLAGIHFVALICGVCSPALAE